MAKLLLATCLMQPAFAAKYEIDNQGSHASINFKISHMGFSFLTGRFNEFNGSFEYDEKQPESSSIVVNINTASVDSNHAERDKHLRSDDFFDVKNHPSAKFISTKFVKKGQDKLSILGNLTLLGVTKPVTIDAIKIGQGEDPWGGYRVGFSGSTSIEMSDFDFDSDYGSVYLDLHIEGIRD